MVVSDVLGVLCTHWLHADTREGGGQAREEAPVSKAWPGAHPAQHTPHCRGTKFKTVTSLEKGRGEEEMEGKVRRGKGGEEERRERVR